MQLQNLLHLYLSFWKRNLVTPLDGNESTLQDDSFHFCACQSAHTIIKLINGKRKWYFHSRFASGSRDMWTSFNTMLSGRNLDRQGKFLTPKPEFDYKTWTPHYNMFHIPDIPSIIVSSLHSNQHQTRKWSAS